ncbi:hypothetical protein V1283_002419 [Bradyrhizobium sp. AZCC 2262]|uniref:hypothetical protein n=1 Tax=Bradyrhizobium sp. AZCC 2262 TaxID=3117022 RepID=UPI002FF3BBFA
MTQDEPATVNITGFGPADTHYIDAAADPDVPNPLARSRRAAISSSVKRAARQALQVLYGGTMLKATGAEETTFKKAAGSYKRSRRLV